MGIVWLSEVNAAGAARVGSKAANLGELLQLGMPVPPGLIIDTASYAEHARSVRLLDALEPMIRAGDWSAVEQSARRALCARPLHATLQNELFGAVRRLCADTVAVRSSGTSEDLAEASFAGQYRTVLNVSGEAELLQAVRECWASLWCARAMAYRHRRSVDHTHSTIAVIIQAMVTPDSSGVLFTIDPTAQRSDRIMIEYVPGLGDRLVSGSTGGVVYHFDRASLKAVDVAGADGAPPEVCTELCRMALDVESHFGCPQDIEFAVRGGEIWLLQSRPITTPVAAQPEPIRPLGRPKLFDRLMQPLVAERYPIAPRPLDNLIYTRLVGAATAGLRRSGGIVTDEDAAAFRAEVWRQAYRFPPHRLSWRFLFSGFQLLGILRRDWLGWWNDGPGPEIRRITAHTELSKLDDPELFDRAEAILATLQEPLAERMYGASGYRAEYGLKLLTALAVGRRRSGRVLAQLLSELRHPTLEANSALWRLSRLARAVPSVRRAVLDLTPKQLQDTEAGRAFLREFTEFLEVYGHRESSCWYLSTPTWRSDPMQVWRLLRSMVEVEDFAGDSDRGLGGFSHARHLVERRLRFIPGLCAYFNWLLQSLRNLTEFRELSHFDLTRSLAALQDIAAEWGHRLTERGVLDTPGSVFYLTHDEIREWLVGRPPDPNDVRSILRRRMVTYRLVNARWQDERFSARTPTAVLHGIATSPGAVAGKARLIRGERQFGRLQPGEILVCPFTTPAWTPLFTSAAAVVAETGGPSSHAAIVAREYGIPAVMNVRGAMAVLQDGVEILVDGDRGAVRVIEPAGIRIAGAGV